LSVVVETACYDCDVPGFVPNRNIKPRPVPVEGNWLWRLIMTLAQHSVPVMWIIEEN
jgi:hypothetical protein